MGERFGRYSKYIIQERALPDIRDGLKPVQRRILYSMNKDGNTHDKGYRKSAKSVGNIMGNFHPHGDSSIYDAMVRMSQDWKNREILVEMHGNNGSMDGDPPAAMRYTEARLSEIAGYLLQDIDKNTVPWAWNFDDTEKEPTVLPAAFPIGIFQHYPLSHHQGLIPTLPEKASSPETPCQHLHFPATLSPGFR